MSATCEQLSAFIDGELSEREAYSLRIHVAGCSACAARMRETLVIDVAARRAFAASDERTQVRAVGLLLAVLFIAAVVGMWLAGGLR